MTNTLAASGALTSAARSSPPGGRLLGRSLGPVQREVERARWLRQPARAGRVLEVSDVLVVTGPPGAGKSTVSALLVTSFDRAALVPGDDFFAFWVRGYVLPWLPEADEQNALVLRSAAAASATLAAGGCPVVYDGVLRPGFLPVVAQEASRHGLQVPGELHYALLMPSLDRCRQNVARRTGHGFTDAAATAHMHADFTAQLPEIEEQHVLRDPPAEPAAVAAVLLERYRAGQLRYRPARDGQGQHPSREDAVSDGEQCPVQGGCGARPRSRRGAARPR